MRGIKEVCSFVFKLPAESNSVTGVQCYWTGFQKHFQKSFFFPKGEVTLVNCYRLIEVDLDTVSGTFQRYAENQYVLTSLVMIDLWICGIPKVRKTWVYQQLYQLLTI